MPDTRHDYFNLPPDPQQELPMKKPKSKRGPRDPEVMKKVWETRRLNQARRADPLTRSLGEAHDEYRKRNRVAEANQTKTEISQAMLEAASSMNKHMFGDTRQNEGFLEQYKTVVRYKSYLENLGFTVTYDDDQS
jgi:hypothetical protein